MNIQLFASSLRDSSKSRSQNYYVNRGKREDNYDTEKTKYENNSTSARYTSSRGGKSCQACTVMLFSIERMLECEALMHIERLELC